MRAITTLFIFLILSCNNNSAPETPSEVQKEKDREAIDKSYSVTDFNGCFWMITGKDTAVAWLAQTENTITGKLSFDNFEKDGSTGTVHGTIEGDVAKLWYAFQSEGMKSIMEVWLKKQGDTLLRGTGDSKVNADSSYFADRTAVKFDTDQVLRKVDCAEVPGKYK